MTQPDILRYPIGKVTRPATVTAAHRQQWIDEIEAAPALLRAAVAGLSDEQLDTPYRPGGWTVRQVVHHVPDSHLNAYVRLRWALTEDDPPIKAYDEKAWAELADIRATPVDLSLALLEALHARWMVFLRVLTEADCARTIQHPENGSMSVDDLLANYAWHGRHHTAHITSLRERMGWG
jgi:uncharacterized damage-inducible protein DinB